MLLLRPPLPLLMWLTRPYPPGPSRPNSEHHKPPASILLIRTLQPKFRTQKHASTKLIHQDPPSQIRDAAKRLRRTIRTVRLNFESLQCACDKLIRQDPCNRIRDAAKRLHRTYPSGPFQPNPRRRKTPAPNFSIRTRWIKFETPQNVCIEAIHQDLSNQIWDATKCLHGTCPLGLSISNSRCHTTPASNVSIGPLWIKFETQQNRSTRLA